jgi:hypothetical protein
VRRLLIVLFIVGLGSWLGTNLQPILAQLASRFGLDTTFVVGVLLFWCLAFVAPYVFFRLRRPSG